MKRRFWIYALPVLLLLAVTLPHLEQGDFRIETAHYAAVGLQAWHNPALFWTPHEHPSVPYFNKPPLVFWIHGLFLHLFGITLAAVRLPAILAAAGCVICTIGLTRRLSGRVVSLLTGCVMALSYEFFRRSREICLDMWQLLFLLMAAWIWIVATQSQRRHLFWLAGIPLGLALMCKPLMALMLLPILCVWLWIDGRHGGHPSMKSILAMILTALVIALPWHLSMIHLHGEAFIRQYFGHEVVARLQGQRNREPVWYYAVEIGRSYWPWMIALFAGLFRWWRGPVSRHHRQMLWLAVAWAGLWAVGLTLFPDKRPRYELPLYPMLAVIAAYGIATWRWRPLRQWYRRGLPITALLIVVISLAIHLLPITFQKPPDKDLSALVEWARVQDRQRVVSAALTAIDESTIFIKAGYWPTPRHLAPRPFPPGTLLIYSDPFAWRPPASAKPVFHQGPYHVVEISTMPGQDQSAVGR
jgi:4-amino-4-deoxy-L-arabinose transferase-like glycosyltransferase